MNRSAYLERASDGVDRKILIALADNARITVRELAQAIGLSAPSVTERIRRLEDRKIIEAYTIAMDAQAIGMAVAAHVRIQPVPGEAQRVVAMLSETPEFIEADRVTGDDTCIAKIVVADIAELESVLDRFLPFAAISTAVIQSSLIKRRIPKL